MLTLTPQCSMLTLTPQCSMLTLTPHCNMLTLTPRRSNAPAASVIGVVQCTGSPYPLQWKSGEYPTVEIRVSYEPKATVEIKGKL